MACSCISCLIALSAAVHLWLRDWHPFSILVHCRPPLELPVLLAAYLALALWPLSGALALAVGPSFSLCSNIRDWYPGPGIGTQALFSRIGTDCHGIGTHGGIGAHCAVATGPANAFAVSQGLVPCIAAEDRR